MVTCVVSRVSSFRLLYHDSCKMGAVEDTCRLMMVLQTQLGGRLSPPVERLEPYAGRLDRHRFPVGKR